MRRPSRNFWTGPALVLLGLSSACATYEPAPVRDDIMAVSDGGSAGAEIGGRSHGTGPNGGTSSRGGAASAGSSSAFGGMSAAGALAGEGGSEGPGGRAIGGGAGLGGSAGGSGQPGLTRSWTFDAGADGWQIRDQSSELQVALTEAAGALRLSEVPFSTTKQFVDLAYEFDAPADLRGRTLRATIQRTSGGFVGAQLYAYAGQWVSPGFESLSSGDVTELTLALDSIAEAGFTLDSVARIGIKLSTGSSESNTFGPTTIELSEVTLD